MQKQKVWRILSSHARSMWPHNTPAKSLSTAALDAGTFNALSAGRYSLLKVLLHWRKNDRHSSLSGS